MLFSSHQEWGHNKIIAFELVILGHVLFPRNLKGVDTRVLAFREQTEKGHTLVPVLLADTFRAINIAGLHDHQT